jgi:hypothetical protein
MSDKSVEKSADLSQAEFYVFRGLYSSMGVSSEAVCALKMHWTDLQQKKLGAHSHHFGENSRAISTLTELLRTPYNSLLYLPPITSALLSLDPLRNPLRADPGSKNCPNKISRESATCESLENNWR